VVDATEKPPARQVLITGGVGPIADALRRQLRAAGFDVVAAGRGEDIADYVATVNAIVVLDASTSSDKDYRLAIDAVWSATEGGDARCIVTVTPLPLSPGGRKAFLAAAESAERRLSDAGHRTTVIRTTMVVGEPDHPGPRDGVILGEGRLMIVLSDGEARIRPIMLDDLAKLIVATIEGNPQAPPAPRDAAAGEASEPGLEIVAGEGPSEMSVRELLKATRPNTKTIYLPAPVALALWAFATVAALLLVVVLPLALVNQAGAISGNLPLVTGALVGGFSTLIVNLAAPSGVIPSKTVRVDDKAKAATAVRDDLRNVTEVWTADARARRKQRLRSARGRRKYAAREGWPLVIGFLVILGLAAVVAGMHDLVVASTLGPKLAAAITTAAGVTMIFGGCVLGSTWRQRYPWAFLATLISAAVPIVVIASGLVNGDPPAWPTVAAVWVLLVAVASAVSLWRLGGLDFVEFVRTKGVKGIGSVLLGGTLAAFIPYGFLVGVRAGSFDDRRVA
jgi:nucleoside-diphosphate-sugar epimerase